MAGTTVVATAVAMAAETTELGIRAIPGEVMMPVSTNLRLRSIRLSLSCRAGIRVVTQDQDLAMALARGRMQLRTASKPAAGTEDRLLHRKRTAEVR